MNALQPLTFGALDGLAFAAQRGRLKADYEKRSLSAGTLGPLFEWIGLSVAGLLPGPERTPWLSLNQTAPLVAALCSNRWQWICPATQEAGLFRTSTSWAQDDAKWVGFGLAAQNAATAVGFHRKIAGQFVGAIGEMVSNIYEHSAAASSGIVAFRAHADAFEFVVADSGIGALQSLRSCAEYRDLSDHGAALQLALTEGVSRFGPVPKRGQGFRPIFIGLANLSGLLRFRSGDHALVIEAQKIDMMSAKIAQKAHLKGFLASVLCQLSGTPHENG